MADVTAIIITKNEELNISECIKSIKLFAARILVVDSGSTDKTVELAKALGAETYYHQFETHAKQRNWAIDNCGISTKWILRLDADERFTPELCTELEKAMSEHENDDVNGFVVEAWLYFMNKKLIHGGSRKKKLIVFKTGIGRIEDRTMDEHTILSAGKAIDIKEKFLHYDFKDLDSYVKKLNWYANLEVQDYFEGKFNNNNFDSGNKEITSTRSKKTKYYKAPMFLRCWLYYFYCLFIKGNFLNGKEGRIYSFLYHFYYRWLIDAKIYEQKKKLKQYNEKERIN